MKSFGYAVLALLLWLALSMIVMAGGTPLLQSGTLPRGDAFIFAIPAVLFIGSVFYVPIVLYLICADLVARRFAYPRNIVAYLAFMAVGALLLSGMRSMMSGYQIRTAFEDPEWIVIPTIVIAALYMIRQVRHRGLQSA